MNTIRSTWIGWGSLCVAGGGAYYFAKKSINADRQTRHEAIQKRKQEHAQAEAEARAKSQSQSIPPPPQLMSAPPMAGTKGRSTNAGAQSDDVCSPSEEIGHDPAPTRHEPDSEAQRVGEKGKYEAAEQFRSRKGNRFS
ncbi:hypothetical protein FQN57_004833 [Myotisia sp. PD_48]|nr:hypothetical protein FQN57_004833 [Myotisia sp. PD_48]